MRIGILTTSYPRDPNDDAGIFVKRLVEGYAQLGHSGVVVVPQDGEEPSEESFKTFLITRYRYGVFTKGSLAFGAGIMPNLRAKPFLIFQAPLLVFGALIKLLREKTKVDLVHANWIQSALCAWIYSLLKKTPYVVTLRGEDVRLLRNPVLALILRIPIKFAHAVVTVNEDFRLEIQKRFQLSSEKIVLIPNGVSVEMPDRTAVHEFAESVNLNPNGKFLLFIGTIIPRKKIEVLIEILSDPKLSEYSLILCGRLDNLSYVEEVKNLVKLKELAKRVHIMGKVSPDSVPYYLSLSHCYLSASEFEGRPNSVLEAIAGRVPVCLSDIDAHREVIDGESGVLFSEGEVSSAVEFILKCEESSYRESVTKQALSQVGFLSWKECAAKYLDLFQKTS